jgi:uncharacterized repeat protein (TIGR03803 family)
MTSSALFRILMHGFHGLLLFSTCNLATAQQESVLYTFSGGTDGGRPVGSLTSDAAGNLYGTTTSGGQYGGGVVFRLSSSAGAWNYSVLHDFVGGFDGSTPSGRLVFDAAGNLYGTTIGGGAQACGTVYELSPTAGGSWSETLIYAFNCGSDGGNPQAGVVLDKAGNLYGTNFSGGLPTACISVSGCGTVFKLQPSGAAWDFVVLHAFQDSEGGNPEAGVTLDATGNLFGTALGFGAAGWGTVYELSPDVQGEQTLFRLLHTFALLKDGGNPGGGIVFGSDGNAYGSTGTGGGGDGSGSGTIYQLEPNPGGHWKFRILYTFIGDFTGGVQQDLQFDSSGNLYGTGGVGLPGWGGIFELSPVSPRHWNYQLFYRFNSVTDGAYPGGVVRDAKGNFFGATNEGGAYNQGVIFEIVP